MRVLVTGASGLVGRRLVAFLAARGDRVVALSRDPARHAWPPGVEALRWDGRSALPHVAADAAVNLAGEPVVGRRWSRAQRQRLRDSRILVTRRVVEWANAASPPRALVSASAAGHYGQDATGPCPEERPAGRGFLADLARDWEREAQAARGRLAVLRLGHVLSAEGGYLGNLLPFTRRHLAGPIAGGRQPMPWVHVGDAVRAFLWALDRPLAGTFNVVSPGAAGGTQGEFAARVAAAVGTPWQMPVPMVGLRLRYGSGASALFSGQDLRTERLVATGFAYRHVDLGEALRDLGVSADYNPPEVVSDANGHKPPPGWSAP